MTLEEVLHKCNDWEYYCREEGCNEYAVNEGGGDIQVELNKEQAKKYGIIK